MGAFNAIQLRLVFIALVSSRCIRGTIVGYENATLVVNNKYSTDEIFQENKNEGETIGLMCQFTLHQTSGEVSVSWNHDSRPITNTQPLEREFVMNTQNATTKSAHLTVRHLKETDKGLYECIVKLDNEEILKRRVQVHVLKPPNWINKESVVSGIIGEKVKVDCRADGNPAPQVDMDLSNDQELPPYFVIGEGEDLNTATIDELKMEHRGVEVKCVASLVYDGAKDNSVVVKTVTVDVFYQPILEGKNEVTAYGILHSNFTISCVVNDTNPPVNQFEFIERGKGAHEEEIVNGHKGYKVNVSIETQSATLFIPMLNASHFEDYTYVCKATNKATLSEIQTTTLRQIHTPTAPHAQEKSAADDANENTIVWIIEENGGSKDKEDYSPILKYRVEYKSIEDGSNSTDVDFDGSKSEELQKNDGNVYKISGLLPNVRYAFRFLAINKAGEGDFSHAHLAQTRPSSSNSGQCVKNGLEYFITSILLLFFLF